jgi:hypothetical protein
MRCLALILSLSFAIGAHAQAPESDYNSTDMSSNWAHEDGFAEASDKRSKTAQFLKDLGQELMQKPAAQPANDSHPTSTGTR